MSGKPSSVLALLLGGALLASARPLPAASTGATSPYMPQGSGSSTAFGDYVSDTAGLNTFYRYFIEVPAGIDRLQVQIFDADVGAGGGTEDTAGRDRARGAFNTTATYSLIDPGGTARTTQFTTGNTASPAGADNAWLDLYNVTGRSVRDSFGTAAYTNNDGTDNWSAAWIETDVGAGAGSGAIQVTGGELRLQDGVAGTPQLQREADLLGSPGLGLAVAFLTFDFRTSNNLEDADQISVEVSGNGGGSWTTLETFSNDGSGSRSYDITAFIANNTRVRFILEGGYSGTEFFFADNVQITDGAPTAGHWELRVDMDADDDINAIGIRAHDGTSGSGGTELNVYFDSHTQLGANPPASGTTSRDYDLFPYITSGCSAAKNDFDYDSNSGTVGSMSFSSRSGSFTRNYASASLSADNSWRRDSFTGWTSDVDSTDYGIWSGGVSITSYLVSGTPNGNYTTFYMSNQLAAANPPAANPTANAFRVYLPSDAGAAPVKPYVEQLLRWDSGPNPPAQGQSSDFAVTVRVVNPTAQAITFSASNLVTANVPGSGAVYGGAAQVSQGSIVSQPSVGGTGNVTWNPGTLAAGGTAILAYEVTITPTSAGQRIAATATPASGNGTRAVYVDETGNTTQARATYTSGPLCELAVTEALLTHAVVSSFRTFADERGGVRVEWTTASEKGTAGFRLLRNGSPVHEGLLPGLVHAAQGGTYRFHDEGASPREPQVYLLEEVEARGRRRVFGPYVSVAEWQRQDGPEPRSAFEREPHPAMRKAVALSLAAAPFRAKATGVHLSIRETGLYYLTREQVAAWLDLTLDKTEKAIARGNLILTRDSQAVAWWPDATGKKTANGLYFYGEALPSLYSLDTVYRLRKEEDGPVMQAGTVAPAPASPGGSFPETKPFETDAFPATAISPDPESDYWFWDFVISGDPDFGKRTFTFDAPALDSSGGGDGTLTVRLQGATDNGVPGEHHAAVRLNGTLLGETEWQGIALREAAFPVPDGVLLATGNQLEILGTVGGGAPFSFFYVDGFDAGYPRQFVAEADALEFTAGQPVTVSGFSGSAVRLLDVTDPLRPRWLTGAAAEANGLSFVPSPGVRYLAAGPGALKSPASVRPWSEPLDEVSAGVLIVVPPGFENEAERLAAHRRSQGLTAAVVNLHQVADLFGNGIATPHALRAFLAWASPAYAVLVGEGTLDYRDLQGFGDSVMPPLMVLAEGGLFPSDHRLAGPGVAVGRIPVLTAAQLGAWIDKILAYEATGEPAWAADVLMLSDSPDGGAVFSEDSDRIAARLPSGYSLDRIDLGSEPLAQARARLFQGIADGASLIDYVGHGGLDRLSAGGLLTSEDVPGLTNGERLPVLTAMTCTVNRFAVPGVPSLGELLVKSPDGGAAAVWGPSGLAFHGESRQLAEGFFRRVDGPGRLGDWIAEAMREFEERGGDADLLDIYNLLGDPALVVRRGPAPPEEGGTGGE